MVTNSLLYDIESIRHKWGWLLTLGIVMIALGVIALLITPAATLATILVLGWLLIFSGVAETIYAIRIRKWGGLFLHLIGGILGVLIGLLIVTHPVAGASSLDFAFRRLLHSDRDVPASGGDQSAVSALGLGSLRQHRDRGSRHSSLGRVAMVRLVVPRISCWRFPNRPWLVLYLVCARDPQLASLWPIAPSSLA